MQWYYARGNDRKGPVEEEQIRELITLNVITAEDLVWNESMGEQWLPVSEVPVFATVVSASASSPFTATGGELANGEITRSARASLKGQWGLAVGGMLLYMLVVIVASSIPIVNTVAPLLIGGPMMLGLAMLFLSVSRRADPRVNRLFDGFSQFGAALGAYLLVAVFVMLWALPLMIGGGVALFYVIRQGGDGSAAEFPVWLGLLLALLTLPVIVATFRYAMTFYALADDAECGPLEAIRRSARMMKGNKWKFFMLNLRFFGWAILALFTLGIGYLFLSPYMMTAMARFYDDVATVGGVADG